MSALQRTLSILLATAMLALSATMAWATVDDFQSRTIIPAGTTVAGVELGGLDTADARDEIERAVATPLLSPVRVDAGEVTRTFEPSAAVEVDIEAMLTEAMVPRRDAAFLSRIGRDLTRTRYGRAITPRFTVDRSAIETFMAELAMNVDRPAVDASRTISEGLLVVRPAQRGVALDRAAAAAILLAALEDESMIASQTPRTVSLPVSTIEPKLTEDTLGKTIVVDLSQRTVRLYDGATLEHLYRCAVGQPQFPTPTGDFHIVNKRFLPTWRNPGSSWAKDMPASIAPGPSNPLGTRALDLDAPGIRLHGTTKVGSIGSAASHGCMRMVRRDIEDLYNRVAVGTPVFIRR